MKKLIVVALVLLFCAGMVYAADKSVGKSVKGIGQAAVGAVTDTTESAVSGTESIAKTAVSDTGKTAQSAVEAVGDTTKAAVSGTEGVVESVSETFTYQEE